MRSARAGPSRSSSWCVTWARLDGCARPTLSWLAARPELRMPTQGYRFVFVVGVSGSGSTLMTRVLGGVPGAVALGGHRDIPSASIPDDDIDALDVVRRLNDATVY